MHRISLWHLDRRRRDGGRRAATPRLLRSPARGRLRGRGARGVRTAVDVLADPLSRPRYGFVSDFSAGRDTERRRGDNVRRLHLNAIQFYDWMYRHADAAPAARTTSTTRSAAPVARIGAPAGRDRSRAGSLPLGYAAVYAAGRDEWPELARRRPLPARRHSVDARRLPLERRPDERALGRPLQRPTCAPRWSRSASPASTSTSTALRSTPFVQTAARSIWPPRFRR